MTDNPEQKPSDKIHIDPTMLLSILLALLFTQRVGHLGAASGRDIGMMERKSVRLRWGWWLWW